MGDLSCLDSLLRIALDADTELGKAAKASLATIPGENIDSRIVVLLKSPKGKMYPLLLQLVGNRRIDAVPDLLKAIDHSDRDVRNAAVGRQLGETVRLQRLSVLISQVLTPKHGENAAVATQALKAASIRMPDREACFSPASSAIDQTKSVSVKISLLEVSRCNGWNECPDCHGSCGKEQRPPTSGLSAVGCWVNG